MNSPRWHDGLGFALLKAGKGACGWVRCRGPSARAVRWARLGTQPGLRCSHWRTRPLAPTPLACNPRHRSSRFVRYPFAMEITFSEEAAALVRERGGTIAIDYIPPIG